jgi:predicted AlkP superfamily phosphohydrolase/phosphomutase
MGEMSSIFINLKGRELKGIVDPGQEYENTRDEIITQLKNVVDPATGQTAKFNVYKREEVYHGGHINEAPDILLVPNGCHPSSRISDVTWELPVISGDHVRTGLFMACGPDIRKTTEPVEGLRIYDITPTILHMFGVPVSADMDGRVLNEIFKDDSEPGQRKVAYSETNFDLEKIKQKIKRLKSVNRI